MVVVRAGAAAPAVRSARRRALGAARLAEHRDGVWLRPDNLDVHLPDAVERDVERFSVRPEGDAVALAAGLWDLDAWAATAGDLRTALSAERPDVPDRLADGFVLSAAVLRHLLADPLLPVELLPAGWHGRALRDEYRRFDAAYRRTLEAWGRGVAVAPTTV
jgi:phenylacetic acid degradation operon negative regulatory protein